MFPLTFPVHRSGVTRGALFTTIVIILALTPRGAKAQGQESGLLDRIGHPDRTLAFPLTNKNFGKTATFKDKAASTRSFALGKSANLAGGGVFRTHSFESAAYKPKDFAFKEGASPGAMTFAQMNKLFDTRSVDVRDARDANKTLAVHSYGTPDAFVVRGKRQDTYDEMLKRKKLSIEEVRDLLNKNK